MCLEFFSFPEEMGDLDDFWPAGIPDETMGRDGPWCVTVLVGPSLHYMGLQPSKGAPFCLGSALKC